MDSEVHTSDGRMDAVVQTGSHTFILEFELDESAKVAMQQIHDKGYAENYRLSGKKLVGEGPPARGARFLLPLLAASGKKSFS